MRNASRARRYRSGNCLSPYGASRRWAGDDSVPAQLVIASPIMRATAVVETLAMLGTCFPPSGSLSHLRLQSQRRSGRESKRTAPRAAAKWPTDRRTSSPGRGGFPLLLRLVYARSELGSWLIGAATALRLAPCSTAVRKDTVRQRGNAPRAGRSVVIAAGGREGRGWRHGVGRAWRKQPAGQGPPGCCDQRQPLRLPW